MTAMGFIVLTVGLAAVVEDVARRRISNWTSAAALLSGFVFHGLHQGWRGAGTAAAGAALGFAIFAVFYLMNGLGGGDVKLMAGFGSLLGPGTILCAAWIAAFAGGLLAAVAAVLRVTRPVPAGGCGKEQVDAIPYAPAIVAGVWLAEIARG